MFIPGFGLKKHRILNINNPGDVRGTKKRTNPGQGLNKTMQTNLVYDLCATAKARAACGAYPLRLV